MKNNRILVGTAVMPLAVGDVSFNASMDFRKGRG